MGAIGALFSVTVISFNEFLAFQGALILSISEPGSLRSL